MSQFDDSGYKTFMAGEALTKGVLVFFSSGNVIMTDKAEQPIGVVRNVAASGAQVTVALLSKAGTIQCKAAGAFSQGAVVYGQDDGTIDDVATSSQIQIGVALEAATAAGDIIEVLPLS